MINEAKNKAIENAPASKAEVSYFYPAIGITIAGKDKADCDKQADELMAETK